MNTPQKMASQLVFSCFSIAVLLAASSATAIDKYTYMGAEGLSNWGKKNPECVKGKYQSPINIVRKDVVHNKKLNPLTRDYKPANATLVSTGCKIKIIFDDHVGNLVIDGKKYALKQVHWHTPAEHQIDGVKFAAELHLFHVGEDEKSDAVIAILYQLGAPDPFINKLSKSLNELAKDKCSADEESHIPLGIFNNKPFMKNTRKFYRYVGSRTTPPCSEMVTWSILGKVRSISKEQLAALKAPLNENCKDNVRPPQPLNGRKVEIYNEYLN